MRRWFAIRVLLPHCKERWPLTGFWEAGQQDNDIGRTQGVTAAFNAIVRQLRASGAHETEALPYHPDRHRSHDDQERGPKYWYDYGFGKEVIIFEKRRSE